MGVLLRPVLLLEPQVTILASGHFTASLGLCTNWVGPFLNNGDQATVTYGLATSRLACSVLWEVDAFEDGLEGSAGTNCFN